MNDLIKSLKTSDDPIEMNDFFLEVGCYDYIHTLVDTDDGDECYNEYELKNGITVIPFTRSDLDWNKEFVVYKKLSYSNIYNI